MMTDWNEDPPPLLLTLQEAERLSGVPYTSLRALVLDGVLPRVMLGDMRRIRIKRADLEALIERSTVTLKKAEP